MNSIFNFQNYFFNPYALPHFIVGILVTLEGVVVLWQSRRSILHIAYFLITITSGIWLTGVGFICFSSDETTAFIWSRYFSWFGIIFVTPAVYLFSVAWDENGLRKKKNIIYFAYISAALFYLICIFSHYLVSGVWHYSTGFFPKAGPLEIVFIVWFYTLMTLSFVNFVDTYRKETIPIKKKSVVVMFIAFAIAFCSSVEYLPNYGILIFPVAFLPMFLFISMMGYCVIRYKLMDIETVIHKTILWLATTVIFLLPIALLSYFMHDLVVGMRPAFFALAILVYSSLFIPYVHHVQPLIDQWFQRGQRNLTEIFKRFTDELVHLKSLEDLTKHILLTIKQAIYPEDLNLILWDEERKECLMFTANGKSVKVDAGTYDRFLNFLALHTDVVFSEYVEIDPRFKEVCDEARSYLSATGAKVCVPIVLDERLIGAINLGRKTNLKRYSAAEIRFLSELRGSAAIAISNSLRLIAMQASLRKWNEELERQVEERTRELREAQGKLIHAEKLATIGTLAGGVAHEINNPLAAILTNAQMLLSEKLDPASMESLQLIEEAAGRCRIIVQKLMKYSRKSEQGEQFEAVNINEIVEQAVALLQYQLAQDNVKITRKLNVSSVVSGNANELSQVLTNLILNARDAAKSKQNAEIEIRTFDRTGQTVVEVEDNGEGIPNEIVSKIFDPFFTTKDVGKGTGLGLSIVQGIIEKHNAQIEVKSKVGQGTVMSLIFQKRHLKSEDKQAHNSRK